MPIYVVERQYFLPVYQRLIVEADSAEEACRKAVEDDDWESGEEDYDGSTSTTINAIKEIPADLVKKVKTGVISSGAFLWEDPPGYGPPLPVAATFRTPDVD